VHTIAGIWNRIQDTLFPHLYAHLPFPLTEREAQLAAILEVVRIEVFVDLPNWRGRPQADRKALARAFVAKAFYNLPTTKALLDTLRAEPNLLRLCGWQWLGQVPSEATFSRAFDRFATSGLLERVHKALVKQHLGEELIGHISRDSTEVEARETVVPKPEPAPEAPARAEGESEPAPEAPARAEGEPEPAPEVLPEPPPTPAAAEAEPEAKPRRGRGRPRTRTEPEPPTRLEQQLTQTPEEALADISTDCAWGAKLDSKGNLHFWKGFKFHTDLMDAGLPLTAVTTAANVHDSQVAIPLAKRTAERVTGLYELMDKAYDAAAIDQAVRDLGHVPVIAHNRRRGGKRPPLEPASQQRFKERTVVERFYSRLKDEFGGRQVRVRGHAKVHAHLMFGLVALFADQLLNLAEQRLALVT
jgi:IS5 family transposase/transposase